MEPSLQDVLHNIIKDEHIINPTIKEYPGCQPGEGYGGVKRIVNLTGENKMVSLFIKSIPLNSRVADQKFMKQAFANEIHFYNKIYPTFEKFQSERGINDPFTHVPKCYATNTKPSNEALVLENLQEQGFVLVDRRNQMNDEHLVTVLEMFANFHAVSYAMKDQDFESYKKLTEGIADIFVDSFEEMGTVEAFTKIIEDVHSIFNLENDRLILENIKNMPEILIDTLKNLSNYADEYSVISKTDGWCTNMMFKYKELCKERPVDMRLIDWKVIGVNSPVLDLSYFFYSVCTKEAMENLDHYLKTYHKRLSKNITKLGSDPEKLYPFAVFKEHWRKCSKYGLVWSFLLIKSMLTEIDEVPDIKDAIKSGKRALEAFVYKIRREDTYRSRVRDVIQHFVTNKFI